MNSGIYYFRPAGLSNEIILFWAGGSESKHTLLIFLGMLLQIDPTLATKLKQLEFEDNVSLSCTWANDSASSPIILRAIEDAWQRLRGRQMVPVNHFFKTESK